MQFRQVAQVAMQHLQESGGASVEVVTGQEAPDFGYMVATPDSREERFRNVTVETLVDYMQRIEWQEGMYLGLWTEDGEVFVDVSQRVEKKRDALRQAAALDEIAVFDLNRMETVYVK